jgi:hypothetical protein
MAREVTTLRRQLRGKLPASAAAALFRIDRDLAELARRTELTASGVTEIASGANL